MLDHDEHTVQGFRANVIRHLVVDEGLSLSDAAGGSTCHANEQVGCLPRRARESWVTGPA